MAKNRKVSRKQSVVVQGATMLCGVILMLFAMVVVNLLADSSCSQLRKSIGAKEKQLQRLADDCRRESARWDEMTTPDRLEVALQRHGLSMHLAKPTQNVRMTAAGKPVPGQLSVARMAQRSRTASTASFKSSTRRR